MTTPEISEKAAAERSRPVVKYRIHTKANEAGAVDDTEERFEREFTNVLNRAYISARRLSYQVNGNNWEVWGFIEYWHPGKAEWVEILRYKTRLREGALPV